MMTFLTFCNDCGRGQTAVDGLQNGMVCWRRWKSSCPPSAIRPLAKVRVRQGLDLEVIRERRRSRPMTRVLRPLTVTSAELEGSRQLLEAATEGIETILKERLQRRSNRPKLGAAPEGG